LVVPKAPLYVTAVKKASVRRVFVNDAPVSNGDPAAGRKFGAVRLKGEVTSSRSFVASTELFLAAAVNHTSGF
jgi:hypothetical protein